MMYVCVEFLCAIFGIFLYYWVNIVRVTFSSHFPSEVLPLNCAFEYFKFCVGIKLTKCSNIKFCLLKIGLLGQMSLIEAYFDICKRTINLIGCFFHVSFIFLWTDYTQILKSFGALCNFDLKCKIDYSKTHSWGKKFQDTKVSSLYLPHTIG